MMAAAFRVCQDSLWTPHLAKAPCGPIAMRRPKDVAVELLASGE